jgi:hypothetical protein
MTTRRTWTTDEDERLAAAVQALAAATLPRQVSLWSAVCGRLAPEVCCTPDSAKARYRRLVEMRREHAEQEERRRLAEELAHQAEAHAEQLQAEQQLAEERKRQAEALRALDETWAELPEDGWTEAERLLMEHEQSEAEDLREILRASSERLAAIEVKLQQLLEMWQ